METITEIPDFDLPSQLDGEDVLVNLDEMERELAKVLKPKRILSPWQ